MVTEKFNELRNQYADATDDVGREIKLKLGEIIACQEVCNPIEHKFTFKLVDRFCELIELINERNGKVMDVLRFQCGELDEIPVTTLNQYMAYANNPNFSQEDSSYEDSAELLDDFYNRFAKKDDDNKESSSDDDKRSSSTMRDYVARIKTFAMSEQYLDEMLSSGVLGVREINTNPILFTYNNIELILARFNTKDENGVAIKQRNNVRSALRLLNDFKREKTSNL